MVFDELDTDHHPRTADIADTIVLAHQLFQTAFQIATYLGTVSNQFSLKQFNRFQRRGARDRVAAKRRGMRARFPVHQISPRDTCAQRQSRGNSFGDADDVRLDAVMLQGKHFSGTAHAALDFVHDEHDAVLVADPPQALKEAVRSGKITAFALHGFDYDCGDFFRRRSGFEQAVLDPIQSALAGAAIAAVFSAERVAIDVRIRHVNHVEHLALETDPLRDPGRSERKRSQRASMKAAKERDEFLASGCVHRQFQSGLDSFSAAVRKVRARRTSHRHNLVQLLGQLRHLAIVVIGAAHVNQLRGLILNCLHDFGMAVTGGTDGDAGVAVEKDIAIDVCYPDSLGPIGNQLERRAWVRWRNKLRVSFYDRSAFRSWQRGFDFWSFRCNSG